MKVCIDSNIIIWGIKKDFTGDQESMVAWAIDFFDWLDSEGIEVMVPELVLAEIMAPEEPSQREVLRNYIEENFIVGSFDSIAVDKFAELMYNHYPDVKYMVSSGEVRKDKMKFDMAIAATAIVQGCDCIYSHDKKMAKVCKGFIEVKEMPRLSMPRPTMEISFERSYEEIVDSLMGKGDDESTEESISEPIAETEDYKTPPIVASLTDADEPSLNPDLGPMGSLPPDTPSQPQ